jgi:hypothetical protein
VLHVILQWLQDFLLGHIAILKNVEIGVWVQILLQAGQDSLKEALT